MGISKKAVALAVAFQDPNLTNGAGKGSNASENWDNRISSYAFKNCA